MPSVRSPMLSRRGRADSASFTTLSANISENDLNVIRPSSRAKQDESLVTKVWELEGRVAVLFRENEALKQSAETEKEAFLEEKRRLEDTLDSVSLNHAAEVEALGQQFEARVAVLIRERAEATDEASKWREKLAEAESKADALQEADSRMSEDRVATWSAIEAKQEQLVVINTNLSLELAQANEARALLEGELLETRASRDHLTVTCRDLRRRLDELERQPRLAPASAVTAAAAAAATSPAAPTPAPNRNAKVRENISPPHNHPPPPPMPLPPSSFSSARRAAPLAERRLPALHPSRAIELLSSTGPSSPRSSALRTPPASLSSSTVAAASTPSDVRALKAKTIELENALLREREQRLAAEETQRAQEELRQQREDLQRARELNRMRSLNPPSFMLATVSSQQKRKR